MMTWRDFCKRLEIGQDVWVFDQNGRFEGHMSIKSINEYPVEGQSTFKGDKYIQVLFDTRNNCNDETCSGCEFMHGCDYECVKDLKYAIYAQGKENSIYRIYWEYVETEAPFAHSNDYTYIAFDKDVAREFAYRYLDVNWGNYLEDLRHCQEEF